MRQDLQYLREMLQELQKKFGITSDPSVFDENTVPHSQRSTPLTEPDAAQWMPPGTPVTIQGVTIPEGMVYVGRKLTAVKGESREPALIDPGLKTAYQPGKIYSPYELYSQPGYSLPDYSKLSAELRGRYLHWLAGGRTMPNVPSVLLHLFLFGIERRLLSSSYVDRETPIAPEEEKTLRQELLTLVQRYDDPHYHEFRYHVSHLLDFLELRSLLSESDTAVPDADKIAQMPQQYSGIPTLLEIGLSRLASSKQPLPAAYAWAWLVHDPDYTGRTPLRRCPEEAHALFTLRYPEQHPKGIKLTLRKATISYSFRPASHSFNKSLYPMKGQKNWHAVGRAPLGRLRVLAEQCADELDAYSRWVLKTEGRSRNVLAGASLLPRPLLATNETILAFEKWMEQQFEKRTLDSPVAFAPFSVLRKGWNGETTPFTRADTLHLLAMAERRGWLIEPDVRYGGSSLHLLNHDAQIAIAPQSAETPTTPEAIRVFAALPLLIAVCETQESLPRRLLSLLPKLPHVDDLLLPRLAARLHFLYTNRDEVKMPRKEVFADLSAEERASLMDVIVAAAGLNITPARTKELLKLFRLIGAEEGELYPRLHTVQTSTALSGEDDFVRVQQRESVPGFALTHTKGKSAPVRRPVATGPQLDPQLIRQKQEETERVSSILSVIFTEDSSRTAVSPEPTTESASSSPDKLPGKAAPPKKIAPAHLLRHVAQQPSWEASAFTEFARSSGWLPNAAREAINDLAFEQCGDALLVGDDPIEVMTDLLPELLEDLS
jgi:hypothetical protein